MTTPTSSPNLLERLALLGSQRTARTERLVETVRALLSVFESACEPGASATVQGHTLARVVHKTKSGNAPGWLFFHAKGRCNLERDLGSKGFIHGDPNVPFTGPTRTELVLFALYAKGFAEVFHRHVDWTVQALEAAQECTHEALAAAGVATPTPFEETYERGCAEAPKGGRP